MAPAAWDADILPKCMRKATMQRISRAWAQRPRETGLRNVLMWGRASWKIIAGSLRPRVGDSGRLDTSMIAEPAGRSEPSLQLKKSATSKLAAGASPSRKSLRSGIRGARSGAGGRAGRSESSSVQLSFEFMGVSMESISTLSPDERSGHKADSVPYEDTAKGSRYSAGTRI